MVMGVMVGCVDKISDARAVRRVVAGARSDRLEVRHTIDAHRVGEVVLSLSLSTGLERA